jgi:uroporphyrinogen decarboxylase
VVGAFVGHIYENAWQIRGYEEFLLDLLERPAWAECLLGRLAAQRRTMAVAHVEAGADVVQCGDDIANQNALMFAPAIWRRIMLPLWRDIWQELKRINPDVRIWYHSDGNISAVVDDLVDAGLDILNPLQPECLDIDTIHRRHGAHLTFDGTIGTQSTMPFGSPEDVRNRVRDVIGNYGANGGLIVSPTHVLEPEVPVANIDAFVDACREYGSAK